jgi:hypothetical protein
MSRPAKEKLYTLSHVSFCFVEKEVDLRTYDPTAKEIGGLEVGLSYADQNSSLNLIFFFKYIAVDVLSWAYPMVSLSG